MLLSNTKHSARKTTFRYARFSIHLASWALLCICVLASEVLAQVPGYAYQEVSSKGNFYRLITGGLGSFVMFFMGLGGVAALFLTRRGARGEGVSLAGVAMLLIAIGIFGLRVLIQAGALGHEYIEW